MSGPLPLLLSADLLVEGPAGLTDPDWVGIGLVLAIVGSFLLAHSILFRHPRQLVRERFGHGPQKLHTIREYIFHRVQVNLGFGFLLAGFGLQLFGRYRPAPAEAGASFPALWIGVVVALAVVLLVGSWWWSLLAFRRYMRDYFQEQDPDFEADLALAREVGELFGITTHDEDTVQAYLARLRRAIGGDPEARRALEARRRAVQLEREERELEEGLV